ncbi:hypothetical protein FRC09_007977 [Ceratobasidium sp. 395]|nr:hypothetical protein FRC09_007977 [Ceratobasidium sp. 395]
MSSEAHSGTSDIPSRQLFSPNNGLPITQSAAPIVTESTTHSTTHVIAQPVIDQAAHTQPTLPATALPATALPATSAVHYAQPVTQPVVQNVARHIAQPVAQPIAVTQANVQPIFQPAPVPTTPMPRPQSVVPPVAQPNHHVQLDYPIPTHPTTQPQVPSSPQWIHSVEQLQAQLDSRHTQPGPS